MVNLECVLEGLHRSEIQSGTHNDPPTGCVSAWIDSGSHIKMATSYDTIEGHRKDGRLASWLHETALRLYPDSKYAKEWRLGHRHDQRPIA